MNGRMGYVTGQSSLLVEMEHRRRDALAGLCPKGRGVLDVYVLLGMRSIEMMRWCGWAALCSHGV